MPLGGNDPLADAHLALWAGEDAAGAVLHLAGGAYRGGDAQGTGIGQGQLHLGFLPFRAKDCHIVKPALGADDGQPLPGKILPRLGKGASS